NYTEEDGLNCADSIFSNSPNVTAILCANDRLAIGAIEAANSRNLKCPDNVSITGFNDTPMIDRIPPGLTTVRILQFDVGRIAAELLVKKMNDPSIPVPEKTIMPVTIVNRGSVSIPNTGN
ncbi:MAG: substrate-binding domain-containing protein, partial [Paracoccaceae bacterium]